MEDAASEVERTVAELSETAVVRAGDEELAAEDEDVTDDEAAGLACAVDNPVWRKESLVEQCAIWSWYCSLAAGAAILPTNKVCRMTSNHKRHTLTISAPYTPHRQGADPC